MENETRKRRMENIEEPEKGKGLEDDEEKMEKFFALIRSSKEIADQMRRGSNGSREKEDKKAEPAAPAWHPSFQPEDFIKDFKDNKAGPSKVEEGEKGHQKKEVEEEEKLDLNLSL
ncbi:hypothetical protein JCGZ_23187 [Jatropha curcas]|uniref:Uncharacterized protein n=1 Tax=Jatropha curcas TaxID=180498 RepID=A0A067JUY6_JATCU|nr:NRR repressor homolog 1 [Jatropha curcas]KDP23354.1 hypothetical protein JCGZ_23187 [Jatropha curcas]